MDDMKEDKFLLMTIHWKEQSDPTLEKIAVRFGVPIESLDSGFGVINVDSESNVFTFMLREAEWKQLNDDISGPYSNPEIEPFGLE
jgi:hypothetical protein